MKIPMKIIVCVIVISLFGFSVSAQPTNLTYLPMVNTDGVQVSSILISSIPLDDNTLVVVTLNQSTYEAKLYDSNGSSYQIDGWTKENDVVRTEVVGCIWVVMEHSSGQIDVRKLYGLPDGVMCTPK